MKIYKNTPDDKSWLQMCFMMSKKESDEKGVNVRRGLRTKAEQGWFPSSWTKPGYMWDRMAERGNKTILSDPIRYHLIKECWKLMLTGAYTVPQILRKLNEEWGYTSITRKTLGGKPMKRSQLYTLFGDPFYYGWYEYKDSDGIIKWQKGNHEPMITEEEFNKVQIMLGRNCKQRMRKHDFPLTGIIRCGECGGMVTCEEKWQTRCSNCKTKFASLNNSACPKCKILTEDMIQPKVYHYIFYRCTKKIKPECKQKYIDSDSLETQVKVYLKNIRISERFKNWALKYLNELNDEEVSAHTATISSLQNSYNDCIKRLDNLVKLKISPQNSDGSLLSDEEFKAQKMAILTEKAKLEDQLTKQGQSIENWIEEVEEKFDFAIRAQYRFEHGSPEEKREIVATIGSNIKLFKQIFSIDLLNEYSFFEKATKEEPTTSYEFETTNQLDKSIQLEDLWAKNPALLPG